MSDERDNGYLISMVDAEFTAFIVRCIEALEVERNVAVKSGDPNPDALSSIDADVRRLGSWIYWLPERLK